MSISITPELPRLVKITFPRAQGMQEIPEQSNTYIDVVFLLASLKKKFYLSSTFSLSIIPRLGQDLRNQVIGMLGAGVAKIHIARQLNCHVSTITCLLGRYNRFGNANNLPKSG